MSNPNLTVGKVKRQKCKASILIEGLTGRGKSGLALSIAKALAKHDQSKIGAIDSENKSLALFQGLPDTDGVKFDDYLVVDLNEDTGFAPSTYIDARDLLINAGVEVTIADSITHMWVQEGGVLDLVSDAQAKDSRRYNNYTAWGEERVKAEKQAIYSVIRSPKVHMICTVRVKEKFEMIDGDNGKKELKSLGEQQIQMPDLKYEPDLVLHMLEPGNTAGKKPVYPKARIEKSRYSIFKKDEIYEFTPELCDQLSAYLDEGVDPETLIEQQRKDYAEGIKQYLDENKKALPVWNQLKTDAGCGTKKLSEMTLEEMKKVFSALTN